MRVSHRHPQGDKVCEMLAFLDGRENSDEWRALMA